MPFPALVYQAASLGISSHSNALQTEFVPETASPKADQMVEWQQRGRCPGLDERGICGPCFPGCQGIATVRDHKSYVHVSRSFAEHAGILVMAERYLLTGCAGFIASKVADVLLEGGHTVVGVDNLNNAYDPR